MSGLTEPRRAHPLPLLQRMTTMKRLGFSALATLIGFAIALFGIAACAPRPDRNGPIPTSLPPRDDRPNQVSSQAEPADDRHVAAWLFTGESGDAKARLKSLILSRPRTAVVRDDGNYLHTTFTSRVFRFTDDVEFLFADASHTIQVRSASRVGHSDLGVNRQRIAILADLWRNAEQDQKATQDQPAASRPAVQ